MNYGMVLVAGLLAGATTCAITQGGLLAGLIARQRGGTRIGAAPATGPAAGPAARTSARPATSPGDDLAPVAGFLGGKFISHVALGFFLGAIGGAIGFDPRIGATAQWVAGVLMVALGLGSLEVRGFRALRFTPPDAWLRVVRRSTRSRSVAAPFMLGLAVLLVPCGVTISMEVLAASSGSPLAGAAVMGVFVLGTAPMFALYGYLSRRLTFHRGFAAGLGALVVALGLVTFNAGLVASGSPITAQALRDRVLGQAPASVAAVPAVSAPAGKPGPLQTIIIDATSTGYVPDAITASAGAPIRLVFRTHSTWSCIRATLMPTLRKQVILPQEGSGSLDLGVLAPGDYPISCGMGMYTATLHVVG